jgi:hypothetical protein
VSKPRGARGEHFWTTLPGILTGVAALITALVGLYSVLKPSPQHGPGARDATQPAGQVRPPDGQVRVQPDAPAAGVPPAVADTGCYVRTSLLTRAYLTPKLFSTATGEFPQNTRYPVHDVQAYQHGPIKTVYFFKIADAGTGVAGWAQGEQLDFIAPECLARRPR